MNSHTGRYPVSFMPIARVGVDVTTRAQAPDHRAIKKDDFFSFKWLLATRHLLFMWGGRYGGGDIGINCDAVGFYVSRLQD